jgi:hypothetical protein
MSRSQGQHRVKRPASGRFTILRASERFLLICPLLAGAAQAQTVTPTQSLSFGRFIASAGGTVSVDVNGARSRGGSVILLQPSAASSATVRITDADPSNASKSFFITLPDTATLSNGSSTMSLSNFVSSPDGIGTLIAGSKSVAIGATLSIAPQQAPGNYSGSFQVTINYQ